MPLEKHSHICNFQTACIQHAHRMVSQSACNKGAMNANLLRTHIHSGASGCALYSCRAARASSRLPAKGFSSTTCLPAANALLTACAQV